MITKLADRTKEIVQMIILTGKQIEKGDNYMYTFIHLRHLQEVQICVIGVQERGKENNVFEKVMTEKY
jgi:hypothetical protein